MVKTFLELEPRVQYRFRVCRDQILCSTDIKIGKGGCLLVELDFRFVANV